MEDYNGILDGDVDRHPPKRGTKPQMSSACGSGYEGVGWGYLEYRNSWQDLHSDGLEFTCHSLTHNT